MIIDTLFLMADIDGSGTLSKDEVEDLAEEVCYRLNYLSAYNKNTVDIIFNQVDKNKNSSLDRYEVREFVLLLLK